MIQEASSPTAIDRLLTPAETSAMLGLKPSTLSAYRKHGVPLPYVRLNCQCVRYKLSEVQAYIAQKESQV